MRKTVEALRRMGHDGTRRIERKPPERQLLAISAESARRMGHALVNG